MLSDRMMTNVSFVDKGSRVADIGCDHGFVSIYLIKQGIAEHVLAMDVAPGPLSRAQEHIINSGLENRIETRLSDGLSELRFLEDGSLEVDTIIAGGIGGRLAVRIVEDNMEKAIRLKKLILQPQSELDYVRSRMIQLGFSLLDEKMIFEDGKFYTTMVFVPGGMNALSDIENLYGPVLLKKGDQVLLEYLRFEEQKFGYVYEQMRVHAQGDEGTSQESLNEVKSKLDRVREAIGLWNGGKYGENYN